MSNYSGFVGVSPENLERYVGRHAIVLHQQRPEALGAPVYRLYEGTLRRFPTEQGRVMLMIKEPEGPDDSFLQRSIESYTDHVFVKRLERTRRSTS